MNHLLSQFTSLLPSLSLYDLIFVAIAISIFGAMLLATLFPFVCYPVYLIGRLFSKIFKLNYRWNYGDFVENFFEVD